MGEAGEEGDLWRDGRMVEENGGYGGCWVVRGGGAGVWMDGLIFSV